jgi:hypothetical protein
MSERADRKPKTIKIPGPDHPITIERNAHRIVVAVATLGADNQLDPKVADLFFRR